MRKLVDVDVQYHAISIGVGKGCSPSPPSEPYVRFSRIRLSSRWFPHRECLAGAKVVRRVNRPCAAKGH